MKPTLIIIEDSEITRDFLYSLVKDEFDVVGMAVTVKEGLALLKAQTPHGILLDLVLPDQLGFDILRVVQALPEPKPKIIVVSRADDGTSVRKAFEEGAVDFISKPLTENGNREKLLASLRAAFLAPKGVRRNRAPSP